MSWIDISQAIGGIATAVALLFVGFQSIEIRRQTTLTQRQIRQTQEEMFLAETGFLRLGLECMSESKEDENYLICKTSLENTSRRPLIVVDAFLLIVGQWVSFKEGINLVMEEINKQKVGSMDQSMEDGLVNLPVIHQYLAKNDNLLHVPDKLTIILLPYYFETLVKLGSFALNRTMHIQAVPSEKVYSIYFAVFRAYSLEVLLVPPAQQTMCAFSFVSGLPRPLTQTTIPARPTPAHRTLRASPVRPW
jgi:hypothetical protein